MNDSKEFNILEWLELNYQAYLADRLLLSQANLFYLKRKIDLTTLKPEYKNFIEESELSIAREMSLHMEVLADTERARDDAIKLAKESESNRQVIEKLNDELRKKQAITEEQLVREQKHRLQLSKTALQAKLSTYLCILSGIAILCPYLFGVFIPVSNELLSHTQNVGILIMNAVMVVVGTLFSNKKDDEDGG